MERQADPVTVDHIIELRREIARLEKEVQNYKNYVSMVYNTMIEIRMILRHCDEPNQAVLDAINTAIKRL
jgi:uncharacterized protein YaaN involved in tellurite resistance